MSTPEENGGLKLELGAFLDLGNKAVKHLQTIAGNDDPVGIFKPLVQSLTNIGVGGAGTLDFGAPAKGRMWVVRELIAFERDHEFTGFNPDTASSTGTAGAAVSASLPFFSPFMTGWDVEIQPAAAAGLATITVSGAGQPNLTYYVEESTTVSVSKGIRYGGPGIAYGTVAVGAVASGGIVTVNVYGVQGGSPANVGWYVGSPDTSIGTVGAKPSQGSLRWTQGQSLENADIFMPFFSLFGNKQFVVTAPDHLLAYITNAIGGENFICIAIVEEFRIRDLEAMSA